ncbi:MAG: DUF1365 family protein [Francisella sp.]|jgi:DUF1365 family protein
MLDHSTLEKDADRRGVAKAKNHKTFSINKFNIFSFYDKDHGKRDGSKSVNWATDLLTKNQLSYDNIKLMTMPRILGYLFNPVSFWLCYHNKKLIAVIAEVNNTFKETHSYICHKDGDEITDKCWFKAQKKLHVSPFYPRQGYYKFNFKIPEFPDSDQESPYLNPKTKIIINYYDNDEIQLGTAITSINKPFSNKNLLKEFIRSPLLTFKVIFLIHYQAIKIVAKKIKYVPKPTQMESTVTVASYISLS